MTKKKKGQIPGQSCEPRQIIALLRVRKWKTTREELSSEFSLACERSLLRLRLSLHCSLTVRACRGGRDEFLYAGRPAALLNIVTGTEGMLGAERQVRHRRLLRYIINKEDKLVGSFHTQLLTQWLHTITAERFGLSPRGEKWRAIARAA